MRQGRQRTQDRQDRRDRQNGQDTRNNSTLDNAYTPPQETIGEVRFITNSFSAEYGRSAGGVLVAAGKSGGNQWHGSVYDYLVNTALNSAPSYLGVRNAIHQNDYGLTVGGPVWIPKVYNGRNRTFFFFSFEEFLQNLRFTSLQ